MKSIYKNADGLYVATLRLKEDERRELKKLAKTLELNDFETIKYAIKLVYWWSKNKIEGEE